MLRTVLITGCSDGGIGSALAHAFHTAGLHVFATARNTAKMHSLSSLPNVTLIELDVTSEESISSAVAIVRSQTSRSITNEEGEGKGRLDYLINNAGQGYVMPLLDSSISAMQKMFEINVWGLVRVTQAFAELVINAKGTIVNNSSTASCLALPFQGGYSASKGALDMLTANLKLELEPLGAKVVLLKTGNIATNWFDSVPQVTSLPSSSYYRSIEEQVKIRAQGKHPYPKMDANEYAKRVVGDVLGGKKAVIWRGAQSEIVSWALMVLPVWYLERVAAKGSGLDVLH
ncbi:oxidoreductase [Talaromyces proteolyticus]|uniref:Oxidoreductase n=1 Tax=Talaromyces proteolyticus TaxID=1131652 RepID=A0AAD4KFE0_9EURO|nr:oxidoreductase [Talaromyces proteolyticus]KAH8689873.1 oxidoreductase [Talaromyces proteolyticus]